MKNLFNTIAKFKAQLILLALLLTVQFGFAATLLQDAPSDYSAAAIVQAFTPIIVLAATFLVNKIAGKIPSILQLTVVAGLSALLAWLTQKLENPELGGWAQFGLGMVATFIHQFWLKLSAVFTPQKAS